MKIQKSKIANIIISKINFDVINLKKTKQNFINDEAQIRASLVNERINKYGTIGSICNKTI